MASSSSEACRLAFLLFVRELAAEEAREETRDWAFFETVLPLSSTCRLRSCMLAIAMEIPEVFSFRVEECVGRWKVVVVGNLIVVVRAGYS